jgi:hypothetical protein
MRAFFQRIARFSCLAVIFQAGYDVTGTSSPFGAMISLRWTLNGDLADEAPDVVFGVSEAVYTPVRGMIDVLDDTVVGGTVGRLPGFPAWTKLEGGR